MMVPIRLVTVVRSAAGIAAALAGILRIVLLIVLGVVLVVISCIVSCTVVGALRLSARQVVSDGNREITCNGYKSGVGGWTVLVLQSIQCYFN